MDVQALAAAFGVPGVAEHLYRQVLHGSGQPLEQVAASLLVDPDVLLERLEPLIGRGIASVDDGVLTVLGPAQAVQHSLQLQASVLAGMGAELGRVGEVLPALIEASGSETVVGGAHHIKGDVAPTTNARSHVLDWIKSSKGDVCFMRPDQWRLPSESEMAVAVAGAIRQGRRVRALYPARALTEAPQVLEKRAWIGEEIRLVPELLTRMIIVGPRAMVPEPLGLASEQRVAVLQPALVRLLQAYFDAVWDAAVPAGGFERVHIANERRRLLLRQLADGAKDEQIARRLDLSLRTVRREVARLMTELGADSRFQAGAEAVRRGLL